MRLYDVNDGAVRIDGHEVRDVALSDLRESVGYVSQNTFLFDGTVAENIRYGRFDAADEDVREAARAARPTSSSRGSRMATRRASASAA